MYGLKLVPFALKPETHDMHPYPKGTRDLIMGHALVAPA